MSSVIWLLLCIGGYVWYRRSHSKLSVYRIEPYLKVLEPIPLCGAPDIVWLRERTRTLIVGDYKSRTSRQVYESDMIQLSVYRFLLIHTQEKAVADYGYIHFADGSRKQVRLLTEKQLRKLYKRYVSVVAGTVAPRSINQPAYCRYCSHKTNCDRSD